MLHWRNMKRIAVIGATSGIGRALTEVLRSQGYDVIACGRRRDLLESLGGESCLLDATAPDAVTALANLHADTIFFNAGFGERSPDFDWKRTETALMLNVVAFERIAQWAIQTGKTFVATASIAGIRGIENTNGYSASKAYMIAAMEGFRRKIRHEKLPARAITVMPGFVDTAMGQASTFWRCSPKTAALCIIRGVARGKSVIYVTPRWGLIAALLRLLPRWIYERIPIQ